MKPLKTVLLMPESSSRKVCALAEQAGIDLVALRVNDLNALERAFASHRDLLLSFETSVIVPSWILELPSLLALNVHAASPRYPGRDPHHFAVYDGATQYGATLHYIAPRVDSGLIIDIELFDVPADIKPAQLLSLANDASWKLIGRFFEKFQANGVPAPLPGVVWGQRKSTRGMFHEMCRIDPSMPREEIERRYRATTMAGYRNLYVDLHGHRFRIEEQSE